VEGCQCFLNDIEQGPNGVLYFTTNNQRLGRITTAGTLQPFIETPFVVGDSLARRGNNLWINDFNTGSIWRYNIATGVFTEFPTPPGSTPLDVAPNGIVWFTDAFDGSVEGQIGRLNPATGAITPIDVAGFPRQINIASDGTVWFTERFEPQGVGRINPATKAVRLFPVDGGPEDIAPAADGSMWFTRTTAGNIARRYDHRRVQGRKGQRAVRDHGRLQPQPLVHDDEREQGRHLSVEVGGEGPGFVGDPGPNPYSPNGVRRRRILGSSPPALCIAPVLCSIASYVEYRRFVAQHT
jgi:sugar lactone lactonase YvrE